MIFSSTPPTIVLLLFFLLERKWPIDLLARLSLSSFELALSLTAFMPTGAFILLPKAPPIQPLANGALPIETLTSAAF